MFFVMANRIPMDYLKFVPEMCECVCVVVVDAEEEEEEMGGASSV